ncbi:MAG: PAS domain S-box protein [Burkholderiales bacterium]|nr:PAS domain S-box protein [Burkholderiales bacterium]
MTRSLNIRPAAIIAAIVLLIAAADMLGWTAGIPALVRPVAGPAMVFNTALCFALIALAVMLDKPDTLQNIRIQQGLGGSVIIVAGAVLGQHLSGITVGLDWPSLHRWFADDNPYPGRMSRPTAWSFLCCGAVLLLMHRVRSLRQGVLVQILTLLPAAIAVVALIGLILQLRFVYANYLFAEMAAATAACFVVISIALCLCWRRAAWYRSRTILNNESRRIGLIGALILAVVTSFAVLAGFSTAQREVESTISDGLLQALKNNISLVMLNVDQRSERATTISSRPRAGEYLLHLQSRHDEAENMRRLAELAGSFLPSGFSGVAFFDDSGKEVLRVGQFADRPEWQLKLKMPHESHLLWWNNSLVLSTRLPVIKDGKVVGAVLAEQTLTALTRALDNIETLGETSEIGICKLEDDLFHCIPQRFMPGVYRVPYAKTLPMSRAVAGETGVLRTRDYRRQNVIAAHGPIGGLGFGMVIKVDTFELYTPIREYLNIALLLLLLSSAGGGWILYARLKPLVGEIERSRDAVREQGARALRVSEDRYSGIVTSAMDAIIAIDERRSILLFNRAAERMFQYSAAQVIGRPLDMLLPLRFRAAHEQHIREFAQSGVTARGMGRLGTISGLRANGEEFAIEASISQVGVSLDKILTVILRDISERIRTKEKAKQAAEVQARLAAIVESSNDAIIMRSLDGRILTWNAAAERLFGWSTAEAMGRPIIMIVPPEQIGILAASIERVKQGETMESVETVRLRKDGSRFFADITFSPVKDEHGRVIAISNTTRDITERKQAESALRELSRRLLETEEAERRAISRELHDRIGQDLSAINLTIDLMRMHPDNPRHSLQSRLDDMQKLLHASIDSTRDIMADLHPAGLEDAGLAVALQYHAERISQRLQIAVTVNNGWHGARPALAIELALFRIAQEAVSNIAKHADARTIRIDLEEYAASNRLVLRISDDGRGFDTAAPRPMNHGLRTMRERARAVDATLRIDSAPGRGTRIGVELQRSAA